jgi:OmpA-OmpF porin, OOP family
MKCNPLRWMWGLIPIVGLGWVATQLERGKIETDLWRRAVQQLEQRGINFPKVSVEGRDALVTGRAPDETQQSVAGDLARATWGVRRVANQIEVVQKVENFRWAAVRDGRAIRLRGNVPDDAARQSIISTARSTFPGAAVDDEMQLARGVPDYQAWQGGVDFALKQMTGLKKGEARLDGLGLGITGEAETADTYRTIKAALANNLPRGVRLTDDRVTAPVVTPYTWVARHNGGQVVLTGYVPNERLRGDIAVAAKASFPRATITDRMLIGEGAPRDWPGVTTLAMKELAKLEEGAAELRDTQVTLSGLAADEATAEGARRGMRGALPSSYRLADDIKVREPLNKPVSPFTTSVVLESGVVILSGYAPSDDAREAAVQAARAKFPNRRIDNRIEVAAGAPDGWKRCFDGGLAGLAKAGNGRMQMSDRRLDVSGSTEDEDISTSVPNEVRQQVGQSCEATTRIAYNAGTEPDNEWRAAWNGTQVVLDGEVTSQAAKAQLAQNAGRYFPGAQIVDRMRVTENRSRAWPATADQGLKMLATLRSGEARLARRGLTIAGEAKDAGVVNAIRDQLERDIAKGYTGRESINVRTDSALWSEQEARRKAEEDARRVADLDRQRKTEDDQRKRDDEERRRRELADRQQKDNAAKSCQSGLQRIAREGILKFERASANLDRESNDTLDQLAGTAKACPGLKIEIEGHTDSEGTPERNQRLSDRRAQAVVDFLIKRGVDQAQLQAIGYGETRPLAPNDTTENRAKNRRIEFTVRGN